MNHDDTFNPDFHSNPAGGGNLPPELEARVVAWVLGEASAFEAAELERLCAERPELAVFRRRIAAVHGLVGAAVRPTQEPLRLSPERRAKLLTMIGSPTAKPQTVNKPVRPRFVWRSWALPMAACLALMLGLSSMMIPTVGRVRETARRSVEAAEARQREMIASMEVSSGTLQAGDPVSFGSTMLEKSSALLGRDDKSTGEADSTVRFDMALPQLPATPSGTFAVVAGPAATAPAAKPAPAPRPPRPDPSATVLGYAGGDQLRSPSSYGVPEPAPAEEKPAPVMDANASGLYADSASVSAPSLSLTLNNEIQSEYVYRGVGAATGLAKDNYGDRPSEGLDLGRTKEDSGNAAVGSGVQVLSDELYVGPPVTVDAMKQSGARGFATGGVSITAGTPQFFGTTGLPAGSVKATEMEKAEIRSKLAAAKANAANADGFAPAPQAANRELSDKKSQESLIAEVSSAWQRPEVVESNKDRRVAVPAEVRRRRNLSKEENFKQTTEASKATQDRLDSTVIPQVNFNAVPLSKVLNALTSLSDEYDASDGEPLRIVMDDTVKTDPDVTITLRNLSTTRVLDFVTSSVGYSYEIRGNAVYIRPPEQRASLETEFIPISRDAVAKLLEMGRRSEAEAGKAVSTDESTLHTFLQQAGVDFDSEPGTVLAYDGAHIAVTQTPKSIQRIKEIVQRYETVVAKEALDKDLRVETTTSAQPVSTFSLHVSDASYRIAKAALARGELPDPTTIRPEEFYNAFDYGDPAPVAGEPVACRVEQSAHPFLQQRNLVRIAMKVPAAGRSAAQPLRLTVLLDTSGSMEREDRAATVRAALGSLASLLGPNDRVTLIGFARTPRLLAFGLPGQASRHLVELAAQTPAEGGTNLEEALRLAGEQSRALRLDGAQNRIVLLTDGAANLGNADPARLAESVEALRRAGIAFDACGVVADGLDDGVLEALTRKGDGRYAVLNSPEEADANFARQLAGAFRPAAKDVKVQVRFNPARVASWRLIGFEQHRLKTEDFRDNKVDAAELAAEEAANALYQVQVLPEGEGELGEVFVRFLDPSSGLYVERSWTLSYDAQAPVFAKAAPAMRLAGSAAFLAEKLRGGELAGQVRLDEFAPVVNGLGTAYPGSNRVLGFIELFRLTRRVLGE